MKKVGEIEIPLDEDIYDILSDDFEKFYKENNTELTEEELEEWSKWLNSPWLEECEKYVTETNSRDDNTNAIYQTYYQVIGYESTSAIVYGYGNTPQESLQDCINNFNYLQEKYNKENILF